MPQLRSSRAGKSKKKSSSPDIEPVADRVPARKPRSTQARNRRKLGGDGGGNGTLPILIAAARTRAAAAKEAALGLQPFAATDTGLVGNQTLRDSSNPNPNPN
eukprot:c23099_g4_i1 orf=1-306(-)